MRRRPGCSTFPHYEVPARHKQPDYVKWQKVCIGMTRDDVIALLGRPLRDPYVAPRPHKDDAYYNYGYLQLPMMPHARAYRFSVGFDEQGHVFTKADPFGGVFSRDGSPTQPMIFTPSDGAVFSHYPRIVDMRWNPVSGQYPISYEVELGRADPRTRGQYRDDIIESDLAFPYFVAMFPGSQPGRFRVRGRNALGTGEWSVYRYFDFSPEGGMNRST